MRTLLPRIVVAAVVAGPVIAALGQQQFTLSEQDEWEATAEIDPTTPEGQLAQARRVLAEGGADRAERLATQWIERHKGHPLVPEAHLLRGDARKADGDLYRAAIEYEYVARAYPGSEAFATALRRELEIARRWAGGERRRLFGLPVGSTQEDAAELFIRIQERMPGSRVAEEAGIALADFYFARREMGLAVDAYGLFIENYPGSEYVTRARRRLVYAYLATFKGPEFDATGLYEAQAQLATLKAVEPTTAEKIGADAMLTRIRESDASKMLTTARWYVRTGDFIGGEYVIRRLLRRHPRSAAAVEGLALVERLAPRLPESVRIEAIAAGVYPETVFDAARPLPAEPREDGP
jgi:outer membrane protein assembly factor BamD